MIKLFMALAQILMDVKPHALVPSPQAYLWLFSFQTPNIKAWSTSQATKKSTGIRWLKFLWVILLLKHSGLRSFRYFWILSSTVIFLIFLGVNQVLVSRGRHSKGDRAANKSCSEFFFFHNPLVVNKPSLSIQEGFFPIILYWGPLSHISQQMWGFLF